MKTIGLKNDHLFGYLVADHLVIFNQSDSHLHALDEMGGWLLLALDDGIGQEEIVNTLHGQGITKIQIAESMATIQSLFFDQSATSEEHHQEYAEILAMPVDTTLRDLGICIEVGKVHFQLIASDKGIQTDLNDIFQGISLHQNSDICAQFVITLDNSKILVECNGIACFSVPEYSQLMPRLVDHLQIMAYQAQSYLLAVHSAMLAKNGRGLILPGLSGAGKSTLCVSLLERGYQFYSDEVAVLSLPKASLIPMVLPPAVKTGSWPVLEQAWPELEQAAVWKREDGRELKYLQLPQAAYPQESGDTSVHAIIFPVYDKSCRHAKFEALDALTALQLLTDAGYQIKESLTNEKVKQLISWIENIPSYRLRYDSLSQAHVLIDEVMQ